MYVIVREAARDIAMAVFMLILFQLLDYKKLPEFTGINNMNTQTELINIYVVVIRPSLGG